MDMNLSKLWELVDDRGAWHAAVHGVTENWTQRRDWTTSEHKGTSFIQLWLISGSHVVLWRKCGLVSKEDWFKSLFRRNAALHLSSFWVLTSNMMSSVLFQATNFMAVYYSSDWKLLQCLHQLVRKEVAGISLVVHWLRLCVSSAGYPGSIPGWGTGSQMLQLKILCATTEIAKYI